jgi:hypothetical protein
MDIKKAQENAEKRVCEICDFICSKKSDWDRHVLRRKHVRNTQEYTNDIIKTQKNAHTCNCGKIYKYYSGLWKHSKICDYIITDSSNNEINDLSNNEISTVEVSYLTNLVLEVVKNNSELQKHTNEIQKQNYELQKQNQEIQKQVLEICKNNNTTTTVNSHNTNSHNKTFNLQFFLNEECKDAMNMSEFINSIQLKLSDLENIGKHGYIEGMSNIIIKQLKNTDMYKRPVHCSDAKRETLYVKEENKWEKEGPDNNNMIKAVHGVDKKNYQLLNTWKEAHPKFLDGQSNQCDEYMKLMSKIMDGDKENINKVIKRVSKEVVIDKW